MYICFFRVLVPHWAILWAATSHNLTPAPPPITLGPPNPQDTGGGQPHPPPSQPPRPPALYPSVEREVLQKVIQRLDPLAPLLLVLRPPTPRPLQATLHHLPLQLHTKRLQGYTFLTKKANSKVFKQTKCALFGMNRSIPILKHLNIPDSDWSIL